MNVWIILRDMGLSPRKASLDAGLRDTFVKDLFAGKSKSPRAHNLRSLADHLGTTVADLLGDAPPERGAERSLPPQRPQPSLARPRAAQGDVQPLVSALVEALPPRAEGWDADSLAEWLGLLSGNLRLLYGIPERLSVQVVRPPAGT